LLKIATLRDKWVLDDEEFEIEKREILWYSNFDEEEDSNDYDGYYWYDPDDSENNDRWTETCELCWGTKETYTNDCCPWSD